MKQWPISILTILFVLWFNPMLRAQFDAQGEDGAAAEAADAGGQEEDQLVGGDNGIGEGDEIGAGQDQDVAGLFNQHVAFPFSVMQRLHLCASSNLQAVLAAPNGQTTSYSLELNAIHSINIGQVLGQNLVEAALEVKNLADGVEFTLHDLACYSACNDNDEACISNCQWMLHFSPANSSGIIPYAMPKLGTNEVCTGTVDQKQLSYLFNELPASLEYAVTAVGSSGQSGQVGPNAQNPQPPQNPQNPAPNNGGPDANNDAFANGLDMDDLQDCVIGSQGSQRGIAQIRGGAGVPVNAGSYSGNSITLDLDCIKKLGNLPVANQGQVPGQSNNNANNVNEESDGGNCSLHRYGSSGPTKLEDMAGFFAFLMVFYLFLRKLRAQ